MFTMFILSEYLIKNNYLRVYIGLFNVHLLNSMFTLLGEHGVHRVNIAGGQCSPSQVIDIKDFKVLFCGVGEHGEHCLHLLKRKRKE